MVDTDRLLPPVSLEFSDENQDDQTLQKNQAKRNFSLNPGLMGAGMMSSNPSPLLDKKEVEKVAARTMSLATRPDTNPMELIELAMKRCKNPIKLSWEKVLYEVDVIVSEEERLNNPSLGRMKR